MKKYTKEELYKMDAVDVYKMVLRGDIIKIFPSGYWQRPDAKENAAKCTRYLIEEILKYDDMLKEKLSYLIFRKNKLRGMLAICFNDSPSEAIMNAYPNKYKPWEFNMSPVNYWNDKESVIKAIKWLIEEKLKLSDEELKEQLSVNLFVDNDLGGMLSQCFNGSPYDAINEAYPNKYKEWEFKTVPVGFWQNKENGIKATKWLIDEKLKLSDEELKEQLSYKLFLNNGFKGMLSQCFNGSPYEAINEAYPNKFKEWEFKIVPQGYWESKENGIKAMKWLIEEKLKLSDEEIKSQLSKNIFKDNGLYGMLQICFNGSPYEAINTTYPNKFKEWELKQVPLNYWSNKENATKATKWLIEEKLKLSDEELKEQLSVDLFIENGLRGMIATCFNNSPYAAINSVYPNKFKKSDFKGYIMNNTFNKK